MEQMIPVTHVTENVPWTGAAALIRPEPWVQDALCAQTDPDAFFPDRGDSAAPAKRVCAQCDVIEQCLEFALRTKQASGVWGGRSERQLRRLRKKAAA